LTDQKKATLYALGAVLIWSTMASAFKLSLRHLEPIQLLLYSGAFATLFLGLVLIRQGQFAQVFRCRREEYGRSLLFGLLNPFLYYLVLLKAYDLLPAQQAQSINYSWAITLTLLSIPLLKQKVAGLEWLALLLSYGGVVIIATQGQPFQMSVSSPPGVALALLSTVIWSLYWIFNTRDRRPAVLALFVNFLCAFPFVLGYALLFSDLARPSLPGLLGAAYIGVLEMGAGFILWLLALKYSENTARIGNLIFIAPFLSLVLIRFLVGERIHPATFGGLLLIVAGLALQKCAARRA
jgi:drug/metabolite transporter (DMT)-like permease